MSKKTNKQQHELCFLYQNGDALIYNVPVGRLKFLSANDCRVIERNYILHKNGSLGVREAAEFVLFLNTLFPSLDKPWLLPKSVFLNEVNDVTRFELILTTSCNLQCKYCYAEYGSYGLQPQHMSSDALLRYLNNLFPHRFKSVYSVMFFGGEPVLNPDAIRLTCDFFNELFNAGTISKYPKYSLVSNGVLINDSIAELIKRYRIQTTVSIDGPQHVHDVLRPYKNGKGSFADASAAVDRLMSDPENKVAIEATYTTKHIELGMTRHDLKEYLRIRFPKVKVLLCDCTGDNEYSIACVTEADACSQAITRQRMGTVLAALRASQYRDDSCDAGLKSFVLMPTGDLYPCHQFVRNPAYCLGNADKPSLIGTNSCINDLLQGARRNTLKPCAECWARELCAACPATVVLDQSGKVDESKCSKKLDEICEILFALHGDNTFEEWSQTKKIM